MWWLFLFACTAQLTGPPLVEVTVVRGDTLSELARTHGTTVDALRAENGLEGDLIEVGQVLRIPVGEVSTSPTRGPKPSPREATAPKAAGHGLTRPAPRPCLAPPDGSDLGEEGVVASKGLSRGQVQGVMGPHLQHTLGCPAQEDSWPTGSVTAELTVACDGTVASVRVLSSTGLASGTIDCVKDVLGYAGFPPHDLPDGYVFTQPVQFSP